MGTSVDCSWGSGGAVSSPDGPGRCFGEVVGVKPPSNFVFGVIHAKTVIVRVNIG